MLRGQLTTLLGLLSGAWLPTASGRPGPPSTPAQAWAPANQSWTLDPLVPAFALGSWKAFLGLQDKQQGAVGPQGGQRVAAGVSLPLLPQEVLQETCKIVAFVQFGSHPRSPLQQLYARSKAPDFGGAVVWNWPHSLPSASEDVRHPGAEVSVPSEADFTTGRFADEETEAIEALSPGVGSGEWGMEGRRDTDLAHAQHSSPLSPLPQPGFPLLTTRWHCISLSEPDTSARKDDSSTQTQTLSKDDPVLGTPEKQQQQQQQQQKTMAGKREAAAGKLGPNQRRPRVCAAASLIDSGWGFPYCPIRVPAAAPRPAWHSTGIIKGLTTQAKPASNYVAPGAALQFTPDLSVVASEYRDYRHRPTHPSHSHLQWKWGVLGLQQGLELHHNTDNVSKSQDTCKETRTVAVWTWKCPRESRPATRRREGREQRWTPQADPVGISRRVSLWHSSADLGVLRERERENASRLQRSSLHSVAEAEAWSMPGIMHDVPRPSSWKQTGLLSLPMRLCDHGGPAEPLPVVDRSSLCGQGANLTSNPAIVGSLSLLCCLGLGPKMGFGSLKVGRARLQQNQGFFHFRKPPKALCRPLDIHETRVAVIRMLGVSRQKSHHCVRPGPSISRHLHLYPWGPFVFQGASSFQPPSLAFPFFVPPPPDSNGASPIGVASAKTNTAPTTTLRSLQEHPLPQTPLGHRLNCHQLAESSGAAGAACLQVLWVSPAWPGVHGRPAAGLLNPNESVSEGAQWGLPREPDVLSVPPFVTLSPMRWTPSRACLQPQLCAPHSGTAGSHGPQRALRTEAKRREWASRPGRAVHLWHCGCRGLECVLPATVSRAAKGTNVKGTTSTQTGRFTPAKPCLGWRCEPSVEPRRCAGVSRLPTRELPKRPQAACLQGHFQGAGCCPGLLCCFASVSPLAFSLWEPGCNCGACCWDVFLRGSKA
ncbi:DAN domain family member 5 BMP antagonist [Cricetulus griseus]